MIRAYAGGGRELSEAAADLADAGRISGVREHRLEPSRDERGCFTEVFCRSWALPIEPAQWSVVRSCARTLRGLYLHAGHDEYFHLVSGRALVVLKDLRGDSPTFGRVSHHRFEAGDAACLAFPRGILHGWYFPDDSVHLQGTSREYSEYHPADNLGCHWADPEVGAIWPDPEPRVSPRSEALPSLAELLAKLAQRSSQP
jgi:dTDP-4-dehydrorhamnose 3,5-epimerase